MGKCMMYLTTEFCETHHQKQWMPPNENTNTRLSFLFIPSSWYLGVQKVLPFDRNIKESGKRAMGGF